MSNFEALVPVIEVEDGFNKKWDELSEGLCRRIERDLSAIVGAQTVPACLSEFSPAEVRYFQERLFRIDHRLPGVEPIAGNIWDELSYNQRRSAALHRDWLHDPANAERWEEMWELQQEEDLWESATASSVAELCEKKRRLKEIRASIEDIGAQIEGKKIVSSSKQCDEKNEQQREISDWYDERVRYWPQGTPTPGREDDVDAAREAFKDHQPPVIDLRGKVLSARRRLAPEHWRRDGPKGHKKAQRKAELKP